MAHLTMTVMVLFIHFPVRRARKCPWGAQHLSVIVEYCSNLEKLKHIIGTILEGVGTLITSARVFAHANANAWVRVQADLDLFRAHMTEWRLLKAELEMVNGCRQGKKEAWEIFIKHTWTLGGGSTFMFLKMAAHTLAGKECKSMRTRVLTSKLSWEGKRTWRINREGKRAALRVQSEPVKCKQVREIKQRENSWETLQSTFPIVPFSQQ